MTEATNPVDRERVFRHFLDIERQENSSQDHLSFLDKGHDNPPAEDEVNQFPQRLQFLPDGHTVVSPGSQLLLAGTNQTVSFRPYLRLGEVPFIEDVGGLDFLHSDIKAACLCVGSVVEGQTHVHWLGRNALENRQCWSATKIVPVLNVVCQANKAFPTTSIQNCVVHDAKGLSPDVPFMDAAIDIVSYRNGPSDSNEKAGMLKRFGKLRELEGWFRSVTGSPELEFAGYYGAYPYIDHPELLTDSEPILKSHPEGEPGINLVSVYDLTRIVSMLGWHLHLPQEAQLPQAEWHSLETVVRAMGYDTARFVDVAIDYLKLRDQITAPVILSKLGFGYSSQRQRTEMTYTAFVQFVDERPCSRKQPAVLRTFAMTLLGAVQKLNADGEPDLDQEACWLDARMAAEVTEIVRRILTQELA